MHWGGPWIDGRGRRSAHGRGLDVVTEAEIEGEPLVHLEVVLNEEAGLPEVVERSFRRVLIHSDGQAEQEVGEGITLVGLRTSLRAGEIEGAIVVE